MAKNESFLTRREILEQALNIYVGFMKKNMKPFVIFGRYLRHNKKQSKIFEQPCY
jgi:hypothetical protein